MRTIALEEHCLTLELRELLGPQIHPYCAAHRWPPALEARLMDLGDKILLAVDHPVSDGAKARQWIDRAPISDEERAKTTHENAERLLGLQGDASTTLVGDGPRSQQTRVRPGTSESRPPPARPCRIAIRRPPSTRGRHWRTR